MNRFKSSSLGNRIGYIIFFLGSYTHFLKLNLFEVKLTLKVRSTHLKHRGQSRVTEPPNKNSFCSLLFRILILQGILLNHDTIIWFLYSIYFNENTLFSNVSYFDWEKSKNKKSALHISKKSYDKWVIYNPTCIFIIIFK